MSLIQQALEKTSRAQETRTASPVQAPQSWQQDPMGAALERELVHVQQKYARRQSLYKRVLLGILFAGFIGGFAYVGVRQMSFVKKSGAADPATVRPAAAVVPPVPVRIYSGNIYRLTGITDLGGLSMALINGRFVGVGDALDGRAIVRAIGDGEVLLEVQGKEIRLTL